MLQSVMTNNPTHSLKDNGKTCISTMHYDNFLNDK